ncbi:MULTISPECIES: tetratricopeptide repeat protein [unclassified Corallococcus]|uniref:tetratricopeptide repeat protein n=1 Tax=unclassified Corallococcus TaxID=2685029 RepID=UPI001A8CF4BD|nr:MULTISPECIES: tetratricopeptide repeat protein [unclassified Corallococcus]MBN9683150.1 tetratricopeptide repeat protein [Corallococcus sp. NCSPR001]WAS85322.1 tetratricopeptide repeat protein [Corallococcus sp. NCRR]
MASTPFHGPPPRASLQLLWVVLAALLVHAPALANGFVYDDVPLLLENPWLRSVDGLRAAFSHSLFGFVDDGADAGLGSGYYRPLAHVTFWLLRAAFGTAPWGYHLLSLLAHAAASVLVWRLLRTCLRGEGREDVSGWAALAGALLFALHPVHTEAVVWVSGWMDLSACLALLFTARLLVPGPVSSPRAWLAALTWLGGLLLKETAIVLPVLLVVLEWGTGMAPVGFRERLRRHGPLAVALAVYAALRLSALGLAAPADPRRLSNGGASLADALALVTRLGGKLLWPHPLVAAPPASWVRSPWEPAVLLGGVCVVGFLGLLGWAVRRRQGAVVTGLSWLAVPLLPVLALQARGVEAYAERYLYLPSVGFVLLVAVGIRALLERWPTSARALTLASGGVLAAFALLTVLRIPVWHDEVSLWETTVEQVPERPSAHAWLGAAYLNVRRVPEAVPHLETAAAALPGNYRVRSDLAVAYAMTGRFEDAVRQLEVAIRLKPGSATPRHNLGLTLRRAQRLEAAVASFREALQLEPGRADSHLELGRTLLQLGRAREAEASLTEALRLKPDLEAARRALAAARSAPSTAQPGP